MSEYKLKTPEKAEKAVLGAYHKIEDTVVGAYHKVEDAVVGTYRGRLQEGGAGLCGHLPGAGRRARGARRGGGGPMSGSFTKPQQNPCNRETNPV